MMSTIEEQEKIVAEFAFLGKYSGRVFGPAEIDKFHIADYVVFTLSLVISLAIGVFFACTGDKQRTTEEFFLASRNAGTVLLVLMCIH